MINFINKWWNDKDILIYKIDNRNIALYGWNGDKYIHCFEVDDTLYNIIKDEIEVLPIYEYLENGDSNIIDFIIVGE